MESGQRAVYSEQRTLDSGLWAVVVSIYSGQGGVNSRQWAVAVNIGQQRVNRGQCTMASKCGQWLVSSKL